MRRPDAAVTMVEPQGQPITADAGDAMPLAHEHQHLHATIRLRVPNVDPVHDLRSVFFI